MIEQVGHQYFYHFVRRWFIVLNVFVTPKDILFGVRIPSQKKLIPEVKKLRKRFIIGMVGITIIMLILAYVQFRLYPRWS